jgi:hypothetical protein
MAEPEQQTDKTDPTYTVSLWKSELERAKKKMRDWATSAEKIVKRYRDERSIAEEQTPRFAVLWSNVQTLLPALYSRAPIPVVQRRYLDRDPVARLACQVLERCLKYELEQGHLHAATQLACIDYALIGRGCAWVRYDAEFKKVPVTKADGSPVYTDEKEKEPLEIEQIERETIPVDYIQWKDFRHGPARVWKEVPWVAKRVYLSREKLLELCDDQKVAKAVPLNYGPDGDKQSETQTQYDELMRAEVWEIWCKDTKKVHWICPEYADAPLKELDDPLELEGFFPCPEPIYTTRTTDGLVPVPDYRQYQGQAIEMDDITRRIDRLVAATKVVGTYDASVPVLGRMLTEGVENDLIANENWAAFAQQGGLKGSVDFMPIEQFASAIQTLMEARQVTKSDIYEITGISDIIRGESDPNETATAQNIKGQYAGLRLKDRQSEISRFIRDIIRIQAEILCQQFQPDTLFQMSSAAEMDEAIDDQTGQMKPDFPQKFQAAVQLLRDERLRGFRIDIETNSTIAPDEQAEKQARVEFLEGIGTLLAQALPAVNQYPAIAPLMGHIVLFAVRGFKAGRELESKFEEAIDAMERNPLPPKPDPEAQKMQLEQVKGQQQMAVQQDKHQAEMAGKAAELYGTQMKTQAEVQKAQMDNHMDTLAHQREMQQMQAQAALQQMFTPQIGKMPFPGPENQ